MGRFGRGQGLGWLVPAGDGSPKLGDRPVHAADMGRPQLQTESSHSSSLKIEVVESLRREHQPVKPSRGVRDGVYDAERRSGGGDGAAQVGPVARTQVRIPLQLIRPSSLRAPSVKAVEAVMPNLALGLQRSVIRSTPQLFPLLCSSDDSTAAVELVKELWPYVLVPQRQWLNNRSQPYRPPWLWSPPWSRVTVMS